MRAVVVALLLLVTHVAAASPRQTREKLRRQWDRSADRLEVWNRGANLQRQNTGRQGRVNATSDAAQKAETPYLPSFVERW